MPISSFSAAFVFNRPREGRGKSEAEIHGINLRRGFFIPFSLSPFQENSLKAHTKKKKKGERNKTFFHFFGPKGKEKKENGNILSLPPHFIFVSFSAISNSTLAS